MTIRADFERDFALVRDSFHAAGEQPADESIEAYVAVRALAREVRERLPSVPGYTSDERAERGSALALVEASTNRLLAAFQTTIPYTVDGVDHPP